MNSNKAKEILRDGKANGKKLTAKQKRYFGWVAGGSKAEDGTMINSTGYLDGAPTANNPYNIIPGQNGLTPITMDGVSQPLIANGQYLPPNSGEYVFPSNQVTEIPVAQSGTAIQMESQAFNPWLYQNPQQRPQDQVTPIEPAYTQPQPMSIQQPEAVPMTQQPVPQEQAQQPSMGGGYAGYIQQGAQAIGNVLDTIGDLRKGIIKGGATVLNALIPDNKPKRVQIPQIGYNRDPYGAQQYNNMFQDGGTVKPSFQEYYSTIPPDKNYMGDYDLQGAYNNLPYDQMVNFATSDGHLPDTYKLPNHPTFSNESMYYDGVTPGAGGIWSGDEYVPNPNIGPPAPQMQSGGKVSQKKALQWFQSGKIDRDQYMAYINPSPEYLPTPAPQNYQQSTYSPPPVPQPQVQSDYFAANPAGGYNINVDKILSDRTSNSGRVGADYDHYTNRAFGYEGIYGNKDYRSTFQLGGQLGDDYEEVDLSPEEIEELRRQGYDIQF